MSEGKLKSGKKPAISSNNLNYSEDDVVTIMNDADKIKSQIDKNLEAKLKSGSISSGVLKEDLETSGYSSQIIDQAMTNFQRKNQVNLINYGRISTVIETYEKQQKLITKKEKIKSKKYDPDNVMLGSLFIGMFGTPTVATTVFALISSLSQLGIAAFSVVPIALGTIGGAFVGVIGGKLLCKYQTKGFELKKSQKITKISNEIKSLEKLLGNYQIECSPGSIILTEDKEDYFIGQVQSVEHTHVTVLQEYERDLSDRKEKIFATRKIALKDILCVFEPKDYTPLSEQEIRQSPLGTPILCKTKKNEKIRLGFLGKVDNQGFKLYADQEFKYKSHNYNFDETETGEVTSIRLDLMLK